MSKDTVVQKKGMGFVSWLTLLLVVLKAFNVIEISWLMVFMPMIGFWAMVGIICIVIFIIAMISS